MQLSIHSVAVVFTLVQTKQIRINIHKRNNTKNTIQTIQNTVHTSTHITKTPTLTHTHTLQNKLKQPQYKLKQTQYKLKQTLYKIYPNEMVTI
jgi:hypothetical protein